MRAVELRLFGSYDFGALERIMLHTRNEIVIAIVAEWCVEWIERNRNAR
jgi:hypothetical protein